MNKRNIWPVILILSSSIFLFVGLLVYLNLTLVQLRKDKLISDSMNAVSESFFAVPFNNEGMEEFVQNLIESDRKDIPRNELRAKFQEVLVQYKSLSKHIDTIFKQLGFDLKYDWTISVPKFELRYNDTTLILYDSNIQRSSELILFGKPEISEDAFKYLFYKTGSRHFEQVNLYIEFTNFYQVFSQQMILVYLVDILLIFLFAAAMRYSAKTLLLQRRTMNLQTDFLNAVSHEFNTPLSSIRIGGQALMKLRGSTNQDMITEFAGGILRQQSQLQNLVDQIVTIGVSENPNFILDENWRCAKDIITENVKIWSEGKDIRDVSIQIGDLPEGDIKTDLQLFRLVLNNLFDNAYKYCDSHPVLIKLWGEQHRRSYRIFISDQGPGISELDLKLVLKKFQRGQDVGGVKKKGLGLGLYLVERIMKLHNGNVEIKSKIGEGTQVILNLPVRHEG